LPVPAFLGKIRLGKQPMDLLVIRVVPDEVRNRQRNRGFDGLFLEAVAALVATHWRTAPDVVQGGKVNG
jgi:hypothetical protein